MPVESEMTSDGSYNPFGSTVKLTASASPGSPLKLGRMSASRFVPNQFFDGDTRSYPCFVTPEMDHWDSAAFRPNPRPMTTTSGALTRVKLDGIGSVAIVRAGKPGSSLMRNNCKSVNIELPPAGKEIA